MADAKQPMSRVDVVNEVAAETNLAQKQVDEVLRAFEGSLRRQLVSGGEVRILGFGTFKVSERGARAGRNPATGETIQIAASKNVRFSAGKAFKDALAAQGGKGGKSGGAKGGAKAGGAKAAAPAKAASSSSKAAPAKAAAASGKGGAKSGGKSSPPSKAAASKGGKK